MTTPRFLPLPDAYDLQGLRLADEPRVTRDDLAERYSWTSDIIAAARLACGGYCYFDGDVLVVSPGGTAGLFAQALIALVTSAQSAPQAVERAA